MSEGQQQLRRRRYRSGAYRQRSYRLFIAQARGASAFIGGRMSRVKADIREVAFVEYGRHRRVVSKISGAAGFQLLPAMSCKNVMLAGADSPPRCSSRQTLSPSGVLRLFMNAALGSRKISRSLALTISPPRVLPRCSHGAYSFRNDGQRGVNLL